MTKPRLLRVAAIVSGLIAVVSPCLSVPARAQTFRDDPVSIGIDRLTQEAGAPVAVASAPGFLGRRASSDSGILCRD